MTARITFDVAGLPVPQGGMRAGLIAGKARVIHSGPKVGPLHDWRHAIATEARAAMLAHETVDVVMLTGALRVSVIFRLPRPAGHTGKRGLLPSAPAYPATRPDIDKLLRASLDALTGVVFADDAQVAAVFVRKDYAEPGRQPGASFEITERLP